MDLTHWITFSLDNYVFQSMGYELYIFVVCFQMSMTLFHGI